MSGAAHLLAPRGGHPARVVLAVEEAVLVLLAGPVAEFRSAGSSLKFCLVAAGEADLYPRLGPTMEWDTAAGQAVAENAGADGAVVVNRVRRLKGKNEGYDADKDNYGDLTKAGVIDPAKVVRTALQNAASVAALLLTTEAMIIPMRPMKRNPPKDVKSRLVNQPYKLQATNVAAQIKNVETMDVLV